MSPQSLTFPNDDYTNSITVVLIFDIRDDITDASEHIYCTTKPGATAVMATWAHGLHGLPVKAPYTVTRVPELSPSLTEFSHQILSLKNMFMRSGFYGNHT